MLGGTLNASSAYLGGTDLTAGGTGTLLLSGSSVATVVGETQLYPGSILNLSGTGTFTSGNLDVGAAGGATGSATQLAATGNTWVGINGTARVYAGGVLSVGGSANLNAPTLDLSNGGALTVSGGTVTIPNRMLLGGGGTYTQSAGVVNVGTISQLGGIANATISGGALVSANVYLAGNGAGSTGTGTLQLLGSGAMVNSGLFKIHAGGNLLVNTSGSLSTQSFDASAGTVTLSAGTISVNGGTIALPASGLTIGLAFATASLQLHGATGGGGTITVGPNSSLGGTGTLAAAVNVGGSLSINSSAGNGSLSVGAVSFSNFSNFNIKYNSSTVTSDELFSSGAVSLGSTASLNFSDVGNSFIPVGRSFTILATSAGVSGKFSGLPEGAFIILPSEALQISYAASGGKAVTLTARSNSSNSTDVVLSVNPSSGAVTLVSTLQTGQAVITAYTIKSVSASLVKFKVSGLKYLGGSFENNPNAFYTASDGNLYNNWTGIKNTATILGEGLPNTYTSSSDTTWTNYTIGTSGYSFGNLFKTLASGGTKDLLFQWNDQNNQTFTGTVSYVDTPIPEPSGVSLIALGTAGLLARRRRRQELRPADSVR
jgi:hypothetical protein